MSKDVVLTVKNGLLTQIELNGHDECVLTEDIRSFLPNVFNKCVKLRKLTISSSVEKLKSSDFEYCNLLETIDVNENNPHFTSKDGIVYSKDLTNMLIVPNNYNSKVFVVPEHVTDITTAFCFNKSIRHLVLSSSITKLDEMSILNYKGITRLVTIPSSVTDIHEEAMRFSPQEVVPYIIGEAKSTAYKFAKKNKISFVDIKENLPEEFLQEMQDYRYSFVENGVRIDKYFGYINEKKLEIPATLRGKNVVEINKEAFTNMMEFKNVDSVELYIPDTVEVIGKNAFEFLGVSKLHLPANIKELGVNSLRNMTESYPYSTINELEIPSSVKKIGKYALSGNRIKKLVIPSSVEEIDKKWFGADEYDLEEVIIVVEPNSYAEEFFKGNKHAKVIYKNSTIESEYILRNFGLQLKKDGFAVEKQNFRYSYDDEELIIPEMVNGVSVVELILENVDFNNLKKIYLPKTIKRISPLFKHNFPKLEDIIIDSNNPYLRNKNGVIYSEKGVVIISPYVSGNVVIDEPVDYVFPHAFKGNVKIKKVKFNHSLQEICEYAFMASSITEVEFKGSVGLITKNAFANCKNFKTIHGIENVIKIEDRAFEGTKITLPSNDIEFVITGSTLVKYNGSKEDVVIPSSVKTISQNAFVDNGNVKTLTIPSTVENIEYYALKNISNLTKVVFEPNEHLKVFDNIFYNCKKLQELILPVGAIELNFAIFSHCNNLNKIVIPDTVTKFSDVSCLDSYSGANLKQFIIDENNKNFIIIDDVIYSKKKTLIKVLPYCSNELNILEGVTKIDEYACNNMKNITQVNLPSSLREIGNSAFENCEKLNNILLNEELIKIESYAFHNCPILNVELPINLKSIGRCAFSYCGSISIYKHENDKNCYSFNNIGEQTRNHNYEIVVKDADSKNILYKVWMGIDNSNLSVGAAFRQAWQNDSFDFTKTDAVYSKMDASNKLDYVCNRLRYPIVLTDENRKTYTTYLVRNAKDYVYKCVDNASLEDIIEFESYGIIKKNNIDELIEYAQDKSVDITAYLMNYKNEKFEEKNKKMSLESLGKAPKPKKEVDKTSDAYLKKIWMVKDFGNGCGVISRYKGENTDIVFPTEIAGIKIVGIGDRGGNPPEIYKQLKSVVIPEGYTTIGNLAFEGCESLEKIEIPFTVKEIGDKAFMGCTSIKEFVFNSSMDDYHSVGKWMLRGCSNLESIYVLHKKNNFIDTACFRDCRTYTVYTFEDAGIKEYMPGSKKIQNISEDQIKYLAKQYFTKPVTRYINIKKDLNISLNEEITLVKDAGDSLKTYAINKEGKNFGKLRVMLGERILGIYKTNDKSVCHFVDYLTAKVVKVDENEAILEISYKE